MSGHTIPSWFDRFNALTTQFAANVGASDSSCVYTPAFRLTRDVIRPHVWGVRMRYGTPWRHEVGVLVKSRRLLSPRQAIELCALQYFENLAKLKIPRGAA